MRDEQFNKMMRMSGESEGNSQGKAQMAQWSEGILAGGADELLAFLGKMRPQSQAHTREEYAEVQELGKQTQHASLGAHRVQSIVVTASIPSAPVSAATVAFLQTVATSLSTATLESLWRQHSKDGATRFAVDAAASKVSLLRTEDGGHVAHVLAFSVRITHIQGEHASVDAKAHLHALEARQRAAT